MEKYVKIGIAVVVVAAVAIVGGILYTGGTKGEKSVESQELNLDGNKKKVDIPVDFDEFKAVNEDVYIYRDTRNKGFLSDSSKRRREC